MVAAGAAIEATAPSRFGGLDGCRGLAALAVVVFHASDASGRATGPGSGAFDVGAWVAPLGNYGVCVFFLLSGFLLYRPFVDAHLRGGPAPALRPYFRRRFLRIFPAYWIAFAAVIATTVAVDRRPNGAWEYLAHLGLVQNLTTRGMFQGLPVAWTLCIEISFYVMLPVLALAITHLPGGRRDWAPSARLRAQLLGVGALVAIAWIYRLQPGLYDLRARPLHLWLPNYLDWFALGMLLAIAHTWRASGGELPRVVRLLADRPWIAWVLAIEIYWIGVEARIPVSFSQAPLFEQRLLRFVVNGASAALVLLPFILGERRTVGVRVLSSRPLVALGTVSYGVYLWHKIVIQQLLDRGMTDAFVPLFAATVALTLAVAVCSYLLVERPIMSLRSRRPAPSAAPRLAPT